MAQLIRSIKRGDVGPDVLAVKRALKAGGMGRGLMIRGKQGRVFGSALDRQVRQLQKKNGIPLDGVYGPVTHKILLPFFDKYGLELLSKAPEISYEEENYNRLLSYMEKMTRDTPGYLYGGGHGQPLRDVETTDPLDCSSSCSKALYEMVLFEEDWAWVSGTFATQYGTSGTGELFTVYANAGHVWIRLYKGKYWRFDTSPKGDGGRGPRLRKLPRFTSSFAARNCKGY